MSGPRDDGPAGEQPTRPLVAITGNASAEEVAALVAVLQAMAAAGSVEPRRPPSLWADPARRTRSPHHAGPDGWRRSALGG